MSFQKKMKEIVCVADQAKPSQSKPQYGRLCVRFPHEMLPRHDALMFAPRNRWKAFALLPHLFPASIFYLFK
jgi:hypothetical protein